MNLTLLGGGNMARAIVSGLVSQGHAPGSITVVDRNPEKLGSLKRDYNVHTQTEPTIIHSADIVLLAVKPQGLQSLLSQCGDAIIERKPLVISILAGITLQKLQALLSGVPIIRAMPNTPARVNAGMTLLCAQPNVSAEQLDMAQSLFNALGHTYITATEREFEQLTALTGCGPAFVFYLVQAMSAAMQEIDPDLDPLPLTLNMFAGALTLMQQEGLAPSELIAQVAPKGGMTEQSMKVLYSVDLQAIFKKTLEAAIKRGNELA